MVALYAEVYGHDRTTATTYINGDVVVCILEDILSCSEQELVAAGGASEVIEGVWPSRPIARTRSARPSSGSLNAASSRS